MEKSKLCRKDKWKLACLIFGVILLASLFVFVQEDKIAKKGTGKEKKKTEKTVETKLEAPKSIRVLLKNSDYGSIYHQEVKVTSDRALKITQGDTVKDAVTGEAFVLKQEAGETEGETENGQEGTESEDRWEKVTLEGGSLSIPSIKRGQGTPVYEGKLEIYPTSEGYVLINEVDFETYVKGVIPGEMPASYELEALKAQAVCARTYAYMKYRGGVSYAEYDAHLDDSVQYQVYNNQQGNERTNQAAEETRGQVLTYHGDIAATYYFSTSWGYTTGMDAWLKEDVPYLSTAAIGEAGELTDFEEAFFNPQGNFYEKTEPWYRWRVDIDLMENKEALFQNLAEEQKESPNAVLVWKDESQSYAEEAPAAFEQIHNMEIVKRGSGGVACTLEITTEKQKLQINGQHNIRRLLAFKSNQIIRQDGSVVKNYNLLPSGFFLIETEKEGEAVKCLKLSGGGFGHGVGMSQNGANQMAKAGKEYGEMLSFFYQGAEIGRLK